ncbi:sigma-70 family RNA polymerase sigma factor [Candidatus Tremblaya phenacola]|uniref:sigma-70 family RNA polymerase sigma factor n=1 Tax=Candidatus Tremblayella phenacoccinincola TaxID=1010676 RepID=UPI001649BEB0|nr:sigma-70 family RNA polymerase sigma factor [Candidatus Tremblaya phenacola]
MLTLRTKAREVAVTIIAMYSIYLKNRNSMNNLNKLGEMMLLKMLEKGLRSLSLLAFSNPSSILYVLNTAVKHSKPTELFYKVNLTNLRKIEPNLIYESLPKAKQETNDTLKTKSKLSNTIKQLSLKQLYNTGKLYHHLKFVLRHQGFKSKAYYTFLDKARMKLLTFRFAPETTELLFNLVCYEFSVFSNVESKLIGSLKTNPIKDSSYAVTKESCRIGVKYMVNIEGESLLKNQSKAGMYIDKYILLKARAYQTATRIKSIRTRIVKLNLRLVNSIIKRYAAGTYQHGLSSYDLAQEGNVGLMKAIRSFDDKRGCKFSTYATWWIRQTITRSALDQSRMIRLPESLIDMINRINRSVRNYVKVKGYEPSLEQLTHELRTTKEKLTKAIQTAKDPVLTEALVTNESFHLEGLSDSSNVCSPMEFVTRSDTYLSIERVLSSLSVREAKILRMRFGIGMDSGHTLEEIGRQFEVTRERVRQIEAKALRKLRQPNRFRKLKTLLE